MGKEKIRRWRYKNSCKYCGEKLSKSVAVIKCKKPKCKDYYHVPCAVVKGMIFSLNFMRKYYNISKNEQIPFYCSNHNKKIVNQYDIKTHAFISSFESIAAASRAVKAKSASTISAACNKGGGNAYGFYWSFEK